MSNYATQVTISSITQAAGVATATTASTADLLTGYVVQILGAHQSAYNGPKSITVASGTTFTFLVPTTTVSPATVEVTGGALTYRQAVLPYIPTVGGSGAPYQTDYHSLAYENVAIVRTTGTTLLSVWGFNGGPEQWIQIYDKATAPTGADIPVIDIKAGAGTGTGDNFFVDIPLPADGIRFRYGVVIVNSLTSPGYSAGAADCWFNAKYHD